MARINSETEAIRNIIRLTRSFITQEYELLSSLKSKYKQTGQRWSDLQYQKFYAALLENEKIIEKSITQALQQVNFFEAKLAHLQEYLAVTTPTDQIGSSSFLVNLEERALFELEVLRDDLELTAGDPDIPQLGGPYGRIRGIVSGFEAHHIPSKAVQDAPAAELPAIAMSAADHALTDSYRGKQNHVLCSKWYHGMQTYRNEVASMIEAGDYMQLVRFELLNIRDTCGHRYDGAIRLYLDALKEYIETNGIPDPVFRRSAE